MSQKKSFIHMSQDATLNVQLNKTTTMKSLKVWYDIVKYDECDDYLFWKKQVECKLKTTDLNKTLRQNYSTTMRTENMLWSKLWIFLHYICNLWFWSIWMSMIIVYCCLRLLSNHFIAKSCQTCLFEINEIPDD